MRLKDTNIANANAGKRVAIVIANPAVSTTTGWPVGFWWSELTHPYLAFEEVGYEIEIVSPNGGPCVADGMSDPNDSSGYSKTDLISQGFIHTPELKTLVDQTRKVAEIDVARFDAILVAGGQAPMFTFDTAVDLQRKFVEFYTAGKVAAAWRIEDALRERGANFIQAVMWRKFAVRDGNLVTGQQNFSGSETARLVIETLGR